MNAQQAIKAAAAFRAGLMFIRGLKRAMAQDAQIKGGWITIGAKKADAEGKGGRKGIHVKVDDQGRVVAGLGGKRSKGKSLKAAIRGLNCLLCVHWSNLLCSALWSYLRPLRCPL